MKQNPNSTHFLSRYAGIAAALASAFIFGFTPILGKLSYAGGGNGITLTFLRAAFAIPVLAYLLRRQGVSFALSRRQVRDLLSVGLLGPAATTVLLYSSYEFIDVGSATTLHFTYPALVTLAGLIFFKGKVGPMKLAALVLSTAGIAVFLEHGGGLNPTGTALALASALSYTVYMLGVEHTSLSSMHYFKLSFYFCVISLFVAGIFGFTTGRLSLQLTPFAWLCSFLVSMFVSIGAITLFQLGITMIGAATTAMLSTLEPITGVVLGMWVLGETVSGLKLVGCALIIAGVMLATASQVWQQRQGGQK